MHPAGRLAVAGGLSDLPNGAGAQGRRRRSTGASTRAATDPADSPTLTLPGRVELHGYDSLSRAKPFESALEMRVPAAADDTPQTGVALFHIDESELIRPGEEGLFSPASGPRDGAPLGLKVRVLPGPREAGTTRRCWSASRSNRATRWSRTRPGSSSSPPACGGDSPCAKARSSIRPTGPYVLVAQGDRRTFTKRSVEVGNRLYGFADVVSGLHDGERVVASHAFVMDAERRAPRTAP